jgi:hypothetical protein
MGAEPLGAAAKVFYEMACFVDFSVEWEWGLGIAFAE